MNGFTQLNDQIVTNSYINNNLNSYSLNDSNVYSIEECVEQQLAFEWNKDLHLECEDITDCVNPFGEQQPQQFCHWNEFGLTNNNNNNSNNNAISNETLININSNVNNDDNYLSINFDYNYNNNNNNNNNNNSSDIKTENNSNNNISKQIVKKANNKLTTNKKISRKESSSSRQAKPVSAYALFFRDAQSVIKSSKPSASFGEISKVVAHNWEALDKHNKDIYKQRADQEKKNYLKSLASSRAKQIAGLMDQSSKLAFNAINENCEQMSDKRDSVSDGFSAENNTQINSTTGYDSTQPQSHAIRAQESAVVDNNAEQLQQNLITTSEDNNTAIAKQHCIRNGCGNDAIDSSEWDSEYCSSECCVKHCSDVFQAWVEKQQLSANNSS